MSTSVERLYGSAAKSHDLGRTDEAEFGLRNLLALQPNHPGALHRLGLIALNRGDRSTALAYLEQVTGLPNADAQQWLHLGLARVQLGDLNGARTAWLNVVRLRPDHPDAWNNLGAVSNDLGKYHDAIGYLQQALRARPGFAEAYHNLGTSYRMLGALPQARAAFSEALRLRPVYPEAANGLGMVLHESMDLPAATRYYQAALTQNPTYPDAVNNLAAVFKEQGVLDQAIACYTRTLRLRPDHPNALYNLSQFVTEGLYQFPDEVVARLRDLADGERGNPMDRVCYCFAYAGVLDARQDHDQAFRYYRQANEMRYRLHQENRTGFNQEAHRTFVDRVIRFHDADYFRRVATWRTETALPIFIVGMPRCGSTLLEQILATNLRVEPREELGLIPRIAEELLREAGPRADAPPLLLESTRARALAEDYLRRVAPADGGADRVTLKTLDNFLHLGLIATLFSGCQVIHCRRDPRDIALSCYLQNFNRLDFTWSFEDIAFYYREYVRLMDHWRRVLPLPIHEVSYEDLIHSPEATTRDLFGRLGLEWDAKCLRFFENRYTVRTASNIQVRKPLSTKSQGRWRRYEKHLGGLSALLGMNG